MKGAEKNSTDDIKTLPPGPRRIKRLVKRTLLVALISLFILEAALQIVFYPSFNSDKVLKPNEYLWYRLRPSSEITINNRLAHIFSENLDGFKVKINSQGLREQNDVSPTPDPDTFRIVCLGDSITFGWGLEEEYTFPRLLQNYLNQRHPRQRFEVINSGTFGYTSRQGLIWLDRTLIDFQPRLLIVQFGYNDSTPPWTRPFGPLGNISDTELMKGRAGAWQPVGAGPQYFLSRLLYRSRIMRVASYLYHSLSRKSKSRGKMTGPAGKESQDQDREEVAPTRQARRVSLSDYKSNLLEICELCRRHAVGVILIDPWATHLGYRRVIYEVGEQAGVPVVSQFNLFERANSSPETILNQERFRAFIEKERRREVLEKNPVTITADFLHPNEIGNILLVEKLAAHIINE